MWQAIITAIITALALGAMTGASKKVPAHKCPDNMVQQGLQCVEKP